METYDLIVIGAGPGGYRAAIDAARLGAHVAIVDKGSWGGTCTHWGCVPTKALLACSRKYAEIRKFRRMGISVSEAVLDFGIMKRHQQQMVRIAALGIRKTLETAGVRLREGKAVMLSPSEVEIIAASGTTDRLRARHILIAWGAESAMPSGIERSVRILDSTDFLALNRLPASVVIIGGGAIGVEFATFLAECGVGVTLVEVMEQLLPFEESDAAELLKTELQKTGTDVLTSARVTSLSDTDSGVRLKVCHRDAEKVVDADYALVCTGRKPFLRIGELDKLSVRYDQRGIMINEHLMTNVDNIYAVGDVTGGVLLAHRAMIQGRALAHRLFGEDTMGCDDDLIPTVVYSHPNVARVGLTEKEARKRGLNIEVRKTDYGSNIIARTELMGNGFIKTIFSDNTLVGVTIAGDEAGELIASMGMAVAHRMSARDLQQWVLPHPTLSEILGF